MCVTHGQQGSNLDQMTSLSAGSGGLYVTLAGIDHSTPVGSPQILRLDCQQAVLHLHNPQLCTHAVQGSHGAVMAARQHRDDTGRMSTTSLRALFEDVHLMERKAAGVDVPKLAAK